MAIALLPMCEGETIGSNLGRYADFVGLHTTLRLRRRLFGHACRPYTKLPSGILHLAEETCDYWGLQAEKIILEHTEFNYATLTLPEAQKLTLFSNMLSQPAGRCFRRSACGWVGERASRFRYCEHCLSEWRRKRVCPYRILCHQLPGVYLCYLHSNILKGVKKQFSEDITDQTLTALRSKDDEQILITTSIEHKDAIEDVAKRSARYLRGVDRLPSLTSFRDLLREAGLVRSSGETDHRGLIESMLTHFGAEYCWLAGLTGQKMNAWSRNIADVRSTCEPSHAFMFIAAESVLYRRSASPGSFVPSIRKGIRDKEGAQFSQAEIECLRTRWHSIVRSARPDKRITAAYRIDSKLYRTLSRYDHLWFMAYNRDNRTPPGRSLYVPQGIKNSASNPGGD
ncbi:TniQ protein [Paraburkholderia sp. BL6669N2]|nr:TniQ protein [Paraburkholderia sp. BL6669N2]